MQPPHADLPEAISTVLLRARALQSRLRTAGGRVRQAHVARHARRLWGALEEAEDCEEVICGSGKGGGRAEVEGPV